MPLLPSNRFFYHSDSGCSRDQLQPGSLPQRQREAVEREPGNEIASAGEKACQIRKI